MQQDVIELIQTLQQQFGWQKIHLLGASMGGIVAQMVAAKRGDLVATLSLLFTTTSEKRLPLPRLDALYTFCAHLLVYLSVIWCAMRCGLCM